MVNFLVNILKLSIIILILVGSYILVFGTEKTSNEKLEYVTLEVIDSDGKVVNKENFEYGSSEYNIRTTYANNTVINTDKFKATSKDYSVILYDKELENHTEYYKDIIENKDLTSDEKSDKIRNDIYKKSKVDEGILILKNSISNKIVGVFTGELTSTRSNSKDYLDRKKVDWWNVDYVYYKN